MLRQYRCLRHVLRDIEPRKLSMRAYRHALLLFSSHRQDETAQLALVVPPFSARAPEGTLRQSLPPQ